MSANAFEKTNLGWQLQQLQQRLVEWLELQLSQLRPSLPGIPNVSTPEWLNSLTWLLVRVAFWVILGWVLIRLVLWLMPKMLAYWNSLNLKTGKQATAASGELTAEGWLLRSRQLYRQGEYRDAARALYMAMLQQLNDSGIAPTNPVAPMGNIFKSRRICPSIKRIKNYCKPTSDCASAMEKLPQKHLSSASKHTGTFRVLIADG